MKILLLTLGIVAVFVILTIVIQKIGNYIRGKHPVDYGYAREHINVLLNFSSFKSFYLAAPENFNLGDETVYFREDGYTGSSDSYGRTRIGFKTNADLWAYQDWHKIIDEKQQEVAYDEAALEFCHKMSRILEEKKRSELEKAQKAQTTAQEVQSRLIFKPREWPNITLMRGDNSDYTYLLQEMLIDAGYKLLELEHGIGIYGNSTASAVRMVRLKHNLGEGDIASPAVIQALKEDVIEFKKTQSIQATTAKINQMQDEEMYPLPPTTDSILGGK